MKKRLAYMIACLPVLLAGCNEKVTVNPDLGEPVYEIRQGEPGSLDETVWNFYQRYGSVILYRFDEKDIRWNWTTHYYDKYVSLQPGNEQYAKRMIEFLQREIFDSYEDNFVRANLQYKIFMVESVTPISSGKPVDIVSKENSLVIGNNGPGMDAFDDAKWKAVKDAMEAIFIRSFCASAPSKPIEFMALAVTGLLIPTPDPEADPLGQYDKKRYKIYMGGFVRGKVTGTTEGTLVPPQDQDLADYIVFLTKTPKTELANVLTRFSKMRARTLALLPYLKNVLDIDVVTVQNKNCPADPVPADFFNQF